MITVKCDQKGCDFTTTQATAAIANRVMGNHKRHRHGIIGASSSAQWKAKHQGVVVRNSEQGEKRPAHVHVAKFCPECGCNLRAVNAALNLAMR